MPRLLRGIARTAVVAGTATAVSNRVSRRQAGRWANQDQQSAQSRGYASPPQGQPYEGQPYVPPAAAEAPSASISDKVDQLHELSELKNEGLLTQDEFDREKRRVLR